ncbi:MAG TPA: ATP-binding protein [Methylophilaceae bacterium]|nr:ATP-binding protein [Methylophilaceae bacterium]
MITQPVQDIKLIKERWNSFKLYNGYRIFIALTLLLSQSYKSTQLSIVDNTFSVIAFGYLCFSLISACFTWFEKPSLDLTLPFQIIADIIFILLLMFTDGASYGGMGLLLVITVAAASLISDGRLALFYAAIATIGILLLQFFSSVLTETDAKNYSSAAMLSIACFAIAWLAYSLARRMQISEELASQRGLDLEGLAQVNALITNKMKDGVLVVDSDLFIKHQNLQAEALLNLENKDWEQKNLHEIAPEIAKLLVDWFEDNQDSSDTLEPNVLKVNILSRALRLSFLPISDSRDQGAVIFIEDWTQMQTQSHQVKLAALGRLTANIAHEIRNPLSSISHANQLLQEDEEASSSTKRMLQIISDNVRRVDQIISDVLELNRRDRTNQEMVHLESFITDFYNQFCAVENISASDFVLNMKQTDATILFDRRHLNQILWNLCKNGWRHSQKIENSLRLGVYTTNKSQITIEVTDDGEGISEEVSNHLFEPFFTTEKSGTGLGLYIGKELAEANGAHLQYKQTTNGTTFIMQIKKATI